MCQRVITIRYARRNIHDLYIAIPHFSSSHCSSICTASENGHVTPKFLPCKPPQVDITLAHCCGFRIPDVAIMSPYDSFGTFTSMFEDAVQRLGHMFGS